MKRKSFLKISAFCVCLGMVFVGIGYIYLNQNMKPTKVETESEPYSAPAPENCGIVFDIEDEKTFLYLDFEDKSLSVLMLVPEEYENSIHGYSLDYTVKGDLNFISAIVDMIDGIDLNLLGEELRYTGVQVADLFKNGELQKREIITAVCNKISQKGFLKENFIYIIENFETDITVPDCYYWSDYIGDMCQSTKIID